MPLQGLGYAGFGSAALDDWRQFGTGLVGLQAVERSASLLAFRMDDRKQCIVIDRAMPEGTRFFGWEVADAADLDALAARLEKHQVKVAAEPRALADARRVRGLISFSYPAGNRLESFYGAEIAEEPFSPGRSISGFRTGPLGLGHAVLTVENIDAIMPFYVDLLGFGLSDYMQKPFRAYFFHINPRHHSLALIETGRNGMHHLMVELFSLDDVGQSYDVALSQADRIGVTLGRHTNDLMTSFYAKTPSSFMVECGWGGREIEPSTWRPFELQDGPSLWGHERVFSPQMLPEKRRGASPGQFGRLAIMHGLPLLVDEGVFGVIAKQFKRLAGRLHALLEGIDQLRRAPIILVGEMGLQRNFYVRRLRCRLRRNAVEHHARGQFGNPGSADDGDCTAEAEAGQSDFAAVLAEVLRGTAHGLGGDVHEIQRIHFPAGGIGVVIWHHLAGIEIGRQCIEAGQREAVAQPLDLVREPPPFLDHDHARRVAAGGIGRS